jgi:hypothetical protein
MPLTTVWIPTAASRKRLDACADRGPAHVTSAYTFARRFAASGPLSASPCIGHEASEAVLGRVTSSFSPARIPT